MKITTFPVVTSLALMIGCRNGVFVYGITDDNCENEENGTSCEDGYECTLNDTCIDGVCTAGEFIKIQSVDTTYKQGSLMLDYTVDATKNIQMTFAYAGVEPALSITKYEAVIHEDNYCVGAIIGKTDNASISSHSTHSTPYPFDVSILADTDNVPKSEPKLVISTPFENFVSPFWNTNTAQCEDEPCALLKFCVTFQSIICGRLVAFVDVNIQIQFDCTEDDESTCLEDVYVQQDALVQPNEFFQVKPAQEHGIKECNGLFNLGIGYMDFCPYQWILEKIYSVIALLND